MNIFSGGAHEALTKAKPVCFKWLKDGGSSGSQTCLGKGSGQENRDFGLEAIHKSNNHIFLLSVFDAFLSWGFAGPGSGLLPRDSKQLA